MMSASFIKFFFAIAGLVGIISFAGFAGQHHWLLDNLSHFRVQYFSILFLLSIGLIFLKSYRAAIFSALLASVNAAEFIPAYLPQLKVNEVTAAPSSFRAVTMNLYSYNQNSEEIRAFLKQTEPDFIVIEEFNRRHRIELQQTLKKYVYMQLSERDDGSGMGFFSRIKFEKADVLLFKDNQIPFVVAKLKNMPGDLTLIGVHLDPPRNDKFFRYRNGQLAQLASLINSFPKSENIMLLGDLNTTAWSHHFKRFIKSTGLIDARKGRGIIPSWPANSPIFWIPIDHCLTSKGVMISDLKTGNDIGSDHFPLIVDFSL